MICWCITSRERDNQPVSIQMNRQLIIHAHPHVYALHSMWIGDSITALLVQLVHYFSQFFIDRLAIHSWWTKGTCSPVNININFPISGSDFGDTTPEHMIAGQYQRPDITWFSMRQKRLSTRQTISWYLHTAAVINWSTRHGHGASIEHTEDAQMQMRWRNCTFSGQCHAQSHHAGNSQDRVERVAQWLLREGLREPPQSIRDNQRNTPSSKRRKNLLF